MRIAILGSGTGSNAKAVLDAWRQEYLGDAEIVGIVSDRQNAKILELGSVYGVKAKYIWPGEFKTKLEGEAELNYIKCLNEWNIDLVVLAGFMRVLKQSFLSAYSGKMINLHPSLLPAFPGLHGVKQAWEAGVKETGCTVHWVSDVIDGGKIIEQAVVTIEEQDTLMSLEAKVRIKEHELLPRVIARLSKKNSRNDKNKVSG